jgi:Fe-S-cluster containining protein
MLENSNVDCIKGRKTGCQTFCCRLLIRLNPDERKPEKNGLPAKGFIEKNPDGFCIHLDKESHLCAIWHDRPQVCREYSCNPDYLLQIALREPVTSMVKLVKKAQSVFIPKEQHIQIPCCKTDIADN